MSVQPIFDVRTLFVDPERLGVRGAISGGSASTVSRSTDPPKVFVANQREAAHIAPPVRHPRRSGATFVMLATLLFLGRPALLLTRRDGNDDGDRVAELERQVEELEEELREQRSG